MSSTQVVVTIIVIVVIILVIAGLWAWSRSRRLKQQFGPEYDRAVKEKDGRIAGERELRERERRHSQLELKELDPAARQRYAASWEDVQILFVEDPVTAVRQGDALVTQLISDRGYPRESYTEQVAQLSVEHAETLQHYRDAHEISEVNERGEATTEQLRQALVHYRVLFAELLGEDSVGRPATDRASAEADRTPVEADRASAEADRAPAEAGRTPVEAGRPDFDRAADGAAVDADRPDRAVDADADVADRDRADGFAPDAERPDATRTVDANAVNDVAADRRAAGAAQDSRTATAGQRAAAGKPEDSRA